MARKKTTENRFGLKDTALFEKNTREKPGEQAIKVKKRKGKTIALAVVLGVVILLVAVPWLIVTIAGNSDNSYTNKVVPKHTYEELLKATEATDKSTELMSLKNPDLNDITAVQNLLDYLKTEEALGQYTLTVKNDTKPFQISLSFSGTHDVTSDVTDDWTKIMLTYSTAILALVDNISQVNWSFPLGSSTESAYFTRADAEKLLNLNVTAKQFAESAQSIQLLLNQLNIELY